MDIMLIQSNCDPSDSKCGYIIYQYFDVLNTIYYIYILSFCVCMCLGMLFELFPHRIS